MNMKTVKYIGAGVGAFVAGIVLMLISIKGVYPAISAIEGLAVAQSATKWNSVRDASVGDNLTDGIFASGLMLFDGTNFDRARGDTTNGLDVDVTRLPGGLQTPADAFANPTSFSGVWSLGGIFNGTTWDRWRGQTTPVQGPTLLNSQTISASNTAITLTLTGAAGTRIHLYNMSANCTNGASSTYTITDGAQVDSGIVPPNPMLFTQTWSAGYTATTAGNVVVVVNACGTGNVGVLNMQADRF